MDADRQPTNQYSFLLHCTRVLAVSFPLWGRCNANLKAMMDLKPNLNIPESLNAIKALTVNEYLIHLFLLWQFVNSTHK